MNLEIISKLPSTDTHKTPLLFVHGAWLGAWCWDVHFLDYFASRGYPAHAVSLRGHGTSEGRERLRWHRISDYVEDVAQAAQRLSCPPIVIGHSMGGLIVQKYLEKHPAPAAVLLASVPPAGVLAPMLRIARRHPLAFVKANLTLSLLPVVSTIPMVREMFFSGNLTDEFVQTYAAGLQDESYAAFLDMLMLDLPSAGRVKTRTPMLVQGAAQDALFYPAQVEATAQAHNTRADILPDTAHVIMLEPRWEASAERIVNWLNAQNLQ